jgi:hypothetical protein
MAINYIFPESPDPLLKTGIDTSSARIGHLNNLVDQVNAISQLKFYSSVDLASSNVAVTPNTYLSKVLSVNGVQSFLSETYYTVTIYSGLQSNMLFVFGDGDNISGITIGNNSNSVTGIQVKYSNTLFDEKLIRPGFYLVGIDSVDINSLNAFRLQFADNRSGILPENRPVLNAPNLVSVINGLILQNIKSASLPNLESVTGSNINLGTAYHSGAFSLPKLKTTEYFISEGCVSLTTIDLPVLEYISMFRLDGLVDLTQINFSYLNGLKGKVANSFAPNMIYLANLTNITHLSIDNIIIRYKEMFENAVGILPSNFSIEVTNCNSYVPSVAAEAALDYLITLPGASINVQGYI